MTQEEKAKAYDELKVKASRIYHKENDVLIMHTIEDLFPELKESEDERIRKALIDMVECAYKRGTIILREKEKEKCIAWLEKQGEHANFRNKIQIGDKVTRNEDGVLVNLSQLKRVAKKDEKQGEHDSIEEPDFFDDFRNSDVEIDSNEDGLIADTVRYKNEMQDKQKSVDKAEPKFHEGEWISGYYTNYKVTAINKEGYSVEDTDGNKINILFENEKFHHLWTIQDAKAGDVLADEYGIYIFNSFDSLDDKLFICKCAYEYSKKVIEIRGMLCKKADVYPATKEQRDLLFQKMKEADYVWDAKKKELKKIEQKPAENKGMNLVEEEMTPFQKKVSCIIDTAIEEEQGLKQVCDELFALASNEIKQKPVWSEEDEINWLESLKDKHTWKPSDEQMDALDEVISKGKLSYINQVRKLISLYNNLKQL